MDIISIIIKKKNKEELTYDELSYAFNGYLTKNIPDYQMSALLMAITINGMTYQETMNLTNLFITSGESYTFNKKTCDKHSTGGVGDTTTFIVAPIVASLNIPMAKMSGRGLGFTGGTIDKLESIPGYKIELSKDDFYNYINKVGIAVGTQTANLVPLDKVIYALRDVTGTTESIPLIASSIMSKKIACGATYIVIDIKVGQGALIKNDSDAKILADWLTKIGLYFNRKVETIITPMNEPLSSAIGNALEVQEAIEVLNGKKCKLADVSVELAAHLISMAKNISLNDAKIFAENALRKKNALKMFEKWITTQGGNLSQLVISDKIINIKCKKSGTITDINALQCAKLALKLGAGRINKDSLIDHSVGIKLIHNIGDKVQEKDVLAELYVKDYNIKLSAKDIDLFTISSS